MITWTVTYTAVRDGVFEFTDTVRVDGDNGVTHAEALAAIVAHHKAEGVDADHVHVLLIEESQ